MFEIVQKTALQQYISYRYTMMYSELVVDDRLYRFGSRSGQGEQFDGIYPTCVTLGEKRVPMPKDIFAKIKRLHQFVDFLSLHNRLFNNKFLDKECIYPVLCDLPLPQEVKQRSVSLQLWSKAGILFTVLYLVVQTVSKLFT